MKMKTYEQPQIEVFEVKMADIICTSPGSGTEELIEDDFDWDWSKENDKGNESMSEDNYEL